jgi:hypothetical protein
LNKQGQIFSLDIIFAVSLFLFILFAIITVSQLQNERIVDTEQSTQMQIKVQAAMSSLLKTSGEPPQWYETENFSSVGLVSFGNYNLDVEKVEGLVSKNSSYYNVTRALGVVPYDFYFEVVNESGIVFSFGVQAPVSSNKVVEVIREAELEGRVVTTKGKVWV